MLGTISLMRELFGGLADQLMLLSEIFRREHFGTSAALRGESCRRESLSWELQLWPCMKIPLKKGIGLPCIALTFDSQSV